MHLSVVSAEVAPKLAALGFEAFLLPSREHRQVWHSAARFPDNAALQQGAPGSLDDEAIDGLLTEVRRVIGTAKFGAALKVSDAVPLMCCSLAIHQCAALKSCPWRLLTLP